MGRFALVAARVCGLLLASALSSAVSSSETITYTYDALGRVVGVSNAGTVNNGQAVGITYDSAGNRTNYTVTGASLDLSVSDVSATEGSDLSFTVTLSQSSSSTVTVNYATSDGTAVAGSDYTATSGALTFTPGQVSKTVAVTTIDDSVLESAETLSLNLSSPSGAVIADGTGTGTINDNEVAADLAIGNASVTEGGTLSFTVTRSGNTSIAASASYASAGVTATSGSDFTAASGTVSFASGETSKTISVSTIDDSTVESSETMTVTLSNPSSGAAITGATGTGTINDNDTPAVTFSINDKTVLETLNPQQKLIFVVTKTGTTSSTLTVNFTTVDGTAIAGSDYQAQSGTLSFTPSQTSKEIWIVKIDDRVREPTETMSVVLSSPSGGAGLSDDTGIGTIIDDD